MDKILYSAIYQLLSPLIRLLLRKGIAFGEFSQIAKQVYVDMAESALLESERKATTSRIAITTGLTRKDVAKLRGDMPEQAVSARYSRGTRVINGWLSDSEYVSQEGIPKILPVQGDEASFETLVGRYSGDIPYRAMLKELQQSQLVDLKEGDLLELMSDAYIPKGDESEQLSILGRDVSLLISTIDHNLNPSLDQAQYFQRKVSYNNLPRESVEQFRKMVSKDGMALLVKFNNWLAERDRDTNQSLELNSEGADTLLAGVGIYYFEESASNAMLKQKGS